nr:sigma-70 family RNA polymerase sigma factor [Oscillospiraceae bacterium]
MPDIESLFYQYKDDVYRLALSFTRNPQEAEDVCQTVFLKLMEQTVTPGKERSWLMQVTANQCRSLLRSHWWRKTDPLEECVQTWETKENTVLAALMVLPPKYRVVLYLHYYECQSSAEIGKLLRISQSAVTTRLSRGRQLLKDALKEEWV